MARTEGRPVPRKAGGEGKKGKKFIEDKSALLSLIDGMPKWTATRPQANKEDMAPDDHMASTNDDGRGIVSFEITKKKPNKKAQSKKSKNKKNKGVVGGVAGAGGAAPSGGGVKVDDGSEGVLLPGSKGKGRADARMDETDERNGRPWEGESEEPAVKKKVVDRLSDKNRELASAKAQIAQKDKERKKRNKLERTGAAVPGGTTKTEGGEGKKKSVGFAM